MSIMKFLVSMKLQKEARLNKCIYGVFLNEKLSSSRFWKAIRIKRV
jgi:hypothetical protein